MVERTYAIRVDGTVSLRRWSAMLSAWQDSLSAISTQVGQDRVLSISIDELTYGSAFTEVLAEFDAEPSAVLFTQAYDSLSRGLRTGDISDVPKSLQKPGKKMLDAARIDSGDGFILSSESGDFVVSPASQGTESSVSTVVPDQVVAYGVVSGRLQALSSRGSLRAVIFDEIHDKAVRCFLSIDQHERARELWDQHVIVQGLISRDPATGRPLSIKNIKTIDVDDSKASANDEHDMFAWRKARGALKHVHPELSSEELIRLVRDA